MQWETAEKATKNQSQIESLIAAQQDLQVIKYWYNYNTLIK